MSIERNSDTLPEIQKLSLQGQSARSQHANLNALLWLLEQERSRLQLKMHLAHEDARQEWNKLEEQWFDFQTRVKHATDIVEETGSNSREALHLLGQELERGYKRLKSLLFKI